MDIYLVETLLNGLLLGGVLALLALGLNLIFGVIDVVWIAYAELMMCGMYAMYWLYAFYGLPFIAAAAVAILFVALLGVLVHLLIIEPVLGSAPINQLLATGGLLFFLQSFATLLFGTDFRNIGGRLAGLAACLLVLQYDVHPFIGNSFGPITFMICVLGGLGNMIGGFVAAFIMSQIISIGGYYFSIEFSYVLAFLLFIVMMFVRPQGIFAR